ncbi:MAG: NfeD family protein [Oligoflexia bacterium]|nr:NfeD family protein [Oligoflexia bacterium]
MQSFEMTATYWWLTTAMVLIIIEVISPAFGAVLIAGAALIAALLASFGVSVLGQFGIFAVSTILSLTLLRPRLVKILYDSQGVQSVTDQLMGKDCKVTEAIDSVSGTGRVLIMGQDWAAESSNKIPIGATVRVEGVDGIRLKVKVIN